MNVLVTTHQMAKGRRLKDSFKPGICKMANRLSVENPDTITIDFDRHVLVKLKEAAEEKIMKVEEYIAKLNERKEKVPTDDIENYELWKSIRNRLGECLVQGKLQQNQS